MTKPVWPPVPTEPATPHPDAPGAGTDLPTHYDHCFACGDQAESGLRMRTSVDDGPTVRSRFHVSGAHQGAPGLAHGGLLACAFDEALGMVVGNLLRVPAVTAKLETDFRRPVPVGSTLYIVAKLDGVAGRKIYASANGHLDAEDGPIAVSARALFVKVAFEHFSNHGDPNAIEKLTAQHAANRRKWDINP